MYFSVIRLQRNLPLHDLALLSIGDGYRLHRLVWKLFADGPDRKRDFIYRNESSGALPAFYTVSERVPRDDEGLWEIQSKAYAPKLYTGQKLAFSLRVNPIRTKRDDDGRQHRHDVIMDAKIRLRNQDGGDASGIIQTECERWLIERSTGAGFNVSPGGVRAEGYRQHKLLKGSKSQPITFSTIDFSGFLEVTAPGVFVARCLFSGLGPAKGFGCGLMLIRPV